MADDSRIDVNAVLGSLIEAWCDRRDLRPLAILLPAYTSNDGLTDGWAAVLQAVYDARSFGRLPETELHALETTIPVLEAVVHRQ
jgi:hypothetical protein